jgi:hypothetical protein
VLKSMRDKNWQKNLASEEELKEVKLPN